MSVKSSGQFSSRIGFIMAAAGSAVGVGNIWGFPTQAATHGGGAFLLVYAVLILLLGFPMLMAELMVGRHGQTNPADAMAKLANKPLAKKIAKSIGLVSIITATLICTFYSILSGWFVSFALAPVAQMANQAEVAAWLMDFSISRNLVFTLLFITLVIWVIRQGVQQGIERWSKRLMPLLLVMLVAGAIYILTQPGAMQGLSVLFVPDFSRVLDTEVLMGALGQTFFSLSVGTGAMMVYGAYLNKRENIAKLTAYVTLMDTSVALLAALMIIPAMYVAQHNGVQIFADDGSLLNSDTLVFSVLPALFDSLGGISQYLLAIVFFSLMTIAGLTSAMSIVEVPTSYLVEKTSLTRNSASLVVGAFIATVACVIVFNFNELFGLIITITTERAQPLIALGIAIYLGWVWHRNSLLAAISQQQGVDKDSYFWRMWPVYVKFVCPVLICLIIMQLFLG
ncbi:transporter [Shewanella sp. 10N.286.52.C2]|uniref:sodium-dependent transporter n=1 Tax=unclassified Shewanella TaxID=196818 RepID=UPI000C8592F2|nr:MULTISPECIES: sodium-dependent transporter [unclassified Shewanella]MDO6620906.1 sodium-dependent transporter [Shewanella sp. 6_MG-2023]MDO6641850.1 sodium-dependent transporter [Shewanella sp. 5_MG-2023]MDO6680094.1 sodium-dependent transporter [Shewanella sp. 4_MG-2023]MDO6776992.1 sodium-dependent transporter [Shewanella sp. 3_MG-2023]PMG28327.1 transporter [Shewanella sp. 10N.286.52.C2]